MYGPINVKTQRGGGRIERGRGAQGSNCIRVSTCMNLHVALTV